LSGDRGRDFIKSDRGLVVSLSFVESCGKEVVMRYGVLAALLVVTSAFAQPNPMGGGIAARPLVGAWQLVSARYTAADGKVTEVSGDQVRSLKVLNDGRFSFVTVKADGTFIRAAAGRYAVDRNSYTETIDYTSVDNIRGKTYTFKWRVEGNTWYHSGELEGSRFEEVWRRAS
jgi:hypothetical protein